ncbi:MAG: hypothetical protein H5U00_11535 [Clostridia bacterium]|nr:hypothetical protein [Clostridia bacterium]
MVVIVAVEQDRAGRAVQVARGAKRAAEAALFKATGREVPVTVRVARVASSAAGGLADGGAA